MLLVWGLKQVLRVGCLGMVDADGRHYRIGRQDGGPAVTVRLHDRAIQRKLLLNPDLYFGEAYMDGRLTLVEGTLEELFELLLRNLRADGALPFTCFLDRWIAPILQRVRSYNPIGRARRNVAHHYDLSAELYDIFLDSERQYSCAYFASENDSLEIAQRNKMRHIAAKLLLRPGQRVLDIGCGWGGLALYLARTCAVDVTGLTLSTEQHGYATARAAALGLSDRVRFHLRDYREEAGQYDRIVSVGMFEHVGLPHFRQFFDKVRELLDPQGVALLHSIGRLQGPGRTSPWIDKYIFPGGYIPALSEVMPAVERCGLLPTDLEILRLHYACTLKEWRRRFLAERERAARLYDERFCRMWEFYLTGSEIFFRHCGGMVFQLQLSRALEAVPVTRDYMQSWEAQQV
ncbi:MAG: class I SAM-dependent methyltransferase [Alphaproteobacteria bacterium]|nr:class I SAM-dependent methyltransferase [Alphaproteobacteria bacterium]